MRKRFVLLRHNKIIRVQSCLAEALNVTQPKIVVLLGTINVSLCLRFYQDQINLGKRSSERRSGHGPPWIQQVSRHTLTSLDSACFIWIETELYLSSLRSARLTETNKTPPDSSKAFLCLSEVSDAPRADTRRRKQSLH